MLATSRADTTLVDEPRLHTGFSLESQRAVKPQGSEVFRTGAARLQANYWNPYRASRWRWRSWPMLLPFVCVVASLVIVPRAALLPESAPGPLDLPQSVRDHAALLWLLCWAPALAYVLARNEARRPIPFLPIIGILYGLYYALAPALGLANFWGRDPTLGTAATALFEPGADYSHPVNMALAGWVACLVGRQTVMVLDASPLPQINRRLAALKSSAIRRWAFALAGIGLVLELSQRVVPFPAAILGAARMLTFISHSAIIVLIVCYRNRQLTRRQQLLTWVCVLATVYVDLGGGATAKVLYIAFAIFIGLWVGRRGMPLRYLAAGVVAVLVCVATRGVMQQWRMEVWWGPHEVPPLEQSRVLVRLLQQSVETRGVQGTVSNGWQVIARRSSNIELLADVMRRTPSEISFWNGFSYRSLTGAFVPRLLWPAKPTKTLGQDFGHRYSYLGPQDLSTSINLPVLVEFYVNFGDAGILIGMFLVGTCFALLERVCNRPKQSVLITAGAAPLFTQLFVMECDLSQQYGGLILQLCALLALVFMVSRLHRRGPRGRMGALPRSPSTRELP